MRKKSVILCRVFFLLFIISSQLIGQQPPRITSFWPLTGVAGAEVTISGTNFSPNPSDNIVRFGGIRAVITHSDSTSLIVTVPTGAMHAPIAVTVNSLTCFSSKQFVPTFPYGGEITPASFDTRKDFTAGHPIHTTLADIDDDGKLDVLVVDNQNSTLIIARNLSTERNISFKGYGFSLGSILTLGPNGMAVEDLDGDGKLDVVTANSTANTISILKNTSTKDSLSPISFSEKIEYAAGNYPHRVAIAEIDRDGKPDIIITNSYSNTISVFRNTSTKDSISFTSKIDFETKIYPVGITVVDLNYDNIPDIVTANQSSSISIFLNAGKKDSISMHSFSPRIDIAAGANPVGVVSNDLDGDGRIDLIVCDSYTNGMYVLRNISTDSIIFEQMNNISAGSNPMNIASGDLNGDNKPDFVTTNWNSSSISIFQNNSVGPTVSVATKVDLAALIAPRGIAIGDIDGDSQSDIVITNFQEFRFSVYRNIQNKRSGPKNLTAIASYGQVKLTWDKSLDQNFLRYRIFGGTDPNPTALIDSTSNNADDTERTIFGKNGVRYYFRITEVDTFYKESLFSNEVGVTILDIGPSITSFTPFLAATGDTIAIVGNNFGATPAFNVVRFGGVKAVVVSADSTMLKVIVPKGAQSKPISVLVNSKYAFSTHSFRPVFAGGQVITEKSFVAQSSVKTIPVIQSVALGDLDDDGKLDVVVSAAFPDSSILVYHNVSSKNEIILSDPITLIAGREVNQIKISDIDGDGKLDIVAISGRAYSVYIFKNKSIPGSITSSSFSSPIIKYSPGTHVSLETSDLDQDGRLDVVVNIGGIYVYRNISVPDSILFSPIENPIGGAGLNRPALFITDVNNDKRPDVIISSRPPYPDPSGSPIEILMNYCFSYPIVVTQFVSRVITKVRDLLYLNIEDLDQDLRKEIVYVVNSSIYFMKNISSKTDTFAMPTFSSPVNIPIGFVPRIYAIHDLNGDGKPEIILANDISSTMTILENSTTDEIISFKPQKDITVNTKPQIISIGDLDGDDKPDIIMTGWGYDSLSIYKNINDIPLGVESETNIAIPISYELHQNYPNPFNPTTTIRYALAEKSRVKLEIFNVLGQKISTLVDAEQEARYYDVAWNPTISSGIYFYRIQAQSINNSSKTFVQVRSMMLLK